MILSFEDQVTKSKTWKVKFVQDTAGQYLNNFYDTEKDEVFSYLLGEFLMNISQLNLLDFGDDEKSESYTEIVTNFTDIIKAHEYPLKLDRAPDLVKVLNNPEEKYDKKSTLKVLMEDDDFKNFLNNEKYQLGIHQIFDNMIYYGYEGGFLDTLDEYKQRIEQDIEYINEKNSNDDDDDDDDDDVEELKEKLNMDSYNKYIDEQLNNVMKNEGKSNNCYNRYVVIRYIKRFLTTGKITTEEKIGGRRRKSRKAKKPRKAKKSRKRRR